MKTHENMLLLLEAMEFASYRLKFETTKNDEPYLNHVIQVCSLLTTIGEVQDIDVLRASILYELIAKSNVKPVDIHLRFGPRTYAIVRKLNLERSFSFNNLFDDNGIDLLKGFMTFLKIPLINAH